MEIQRIREYRSRLDNGGNMSVQELHYLFSEIEYLHKTREDLVYTINQLKEKLDETHNRPVVWPVPVS